MRCLVCAAEMYVTQVEQDRTMPVPGFEHHTLECLECGDITAEEAINESGYSHL